MRLLPIGLFALLLISITYAQDIIVYSSQGYQGIQYPLNIGGSIVFTPTGRGWSCFSFRIFSQNAAIKVTPLSQPIGREGPYNCFIYSEVDMPRYFGTDQYCGKTLRAECVTRNLPQPDVFVPFDFSDANPNEENDHYLRPYVNGHRMLVLRKAFFWENSEPLGGGHGPYEDIKIAVCKKDILNYDFIYLVEHQDFWQQLLLTIPVMELPGPVWSGYASAGYPDPYDEWIDGPWGCVYSNIALWDWGICPGSGQPVVPIVYTTDSDNFFFPSELDGNNLAGVYDNIITPDMEGPILFKVRMFGWVILENICVNGEEPHFPSNNSVYWLNGWNGVHPETIYGPQNAAVPREAYPGNQFRPFTTQQFFDRFYNNRSYDGWNIGLLSGKFPAMTISKRGTYRAFGHPAVFGGN